MSKGTSRQEAVGLVTDAVGHLIEFWGFKRTLGRVWATLYLAPEPLPAAELCKRLRISVGAASTSLAELERWGVVHRQHREGERKEYFEAETNVWKMVSHVYEQRERREIDRLVEALDAAIARLEKANDAESKFVARRLSRLLLLAKAGRAVLGTLLGGGAADLKAVREHGLE